MDVDHDARLRKKAREAIRLRDVSPQETIAMGFQLMTFTRKLAEAADRAER